MDLKSLPFPPEPRLIHLRGLPAPLRLYAPASVDSLLERMDLDAPDADERIPYWAEIWPSALGLGEWLLDGRGPREPGRTLEIGAGLGLTGLVTLTLGWDTTLTDFDGAALIWAARNLEANGFPAERARHLDWREPPAETWDTIIAGDILYEKVFAEPLAVFFDRALRPGGRAIIAEPCRPVADTHLALFESRFELRITPWRGPESAGGRPLRIIELSRPAQAKAGSSSS